MPDYFWIEDTDQNWIPVSGYAYSKLESLESGLYAYFVSLGHVGPRMSENQSSWTIVSSFIGQGSKYYWAITNDFSEDLGFVYKFEQYIAPISLSYYEEEVISSEKIPTGVLFYRPPADPYEP